MALLIDNGADLNAAFEDGTTPFDSACAHGHLSIAQLLFQRGTIINHPDHCGHPAITSASNNGHYKIVEF